MPLNMDSLFSKFRNLFSGNRKSKENESKEKSQKGKLHLGGEHRTRSSDLLREVEHFPGKTSTLFEEQKYQQNSPAKIYPSLSGLDYQYKPTAPVQPTFYHQKVVLTGHERYCSFDKEESLYKASAPIGPVFNEKEELQKQTFQLYPDLSQQDFQHRQKEAKSLQIPSSIKSTEWENPYFQQHVECIKPPAFVNSDRCPKNPYDQNRSNTVKQTLPEHPILSHTENVSMKLESNRKAVVTPVKQTLPVHPLPRHSENIPKKLEGIRKAVATPVRKTLPVEPLSNHSENVSRKSETRTCFVGVPSSEQNKRLQVFSETDILATKKCSMPPDDFRKIEVLPDKKELIKDVQPFFRSNIVDRPYDSVDEYLDIQFRLLREDFVAPLRKIVSICWKLKDLDVILESKEHKRNLFSIYDNVKVSHTEPKLDDDAEVLYWLDLQEHKEKLRNFEVTRKLMFGSVICLFNQSFTELSVCIVSEKGTTSDLKVGVTGGLPKVENNLGKIKDYGYVLIEAPAYFEAYVHVLKRLQRIEEVPLKRYILDCINFPQHPSYLSSLSKYDYTAIQKDESKHDAFFGNHSLTVLDPRTWPNAQDVVLNSSQLKALQNCLTNELAVVQGPPGTGKTFLALKLAEVLLANRQVWQNSNWKGTLLVVCQTNHALDQFLEGVLKFNDNVIRVGNRSKSKALRNKTLPKILSGAALIERKDEETKKITALKDILKCSKEAVMHSDIIEEFGDIDKDMVIVSNEYGGMHKWLGIKSSDEVVENAKSETEKWFNRSKQKKKRGVKISKTFRAVKVVRRKQSLEECEFEEVVKISVPKQKKNRPDDDEDVEFLKPLTLSETSSQEEKDIFWLKLKDLCKRCPMSEIRIQIDFEDPKNSEEEKKKLYEASETISLGLIHKKLNRHLEQNLSNNSTLRATQSTKRSSSEPKKWEKYCFWLRCFQQEVESKIEICENNLKTTVKKLEEQRKKPRHEIISSAHVVGMTTTGAAKFASVMNNAYIPIVIVEEASEVLEAHIVTALNSKVQHLILIGDHKQLRPNPETYDLAISHNLDISLFERLIMNEFEYDQLREQRRMRPHISELIHPHIYSHLSNHQSVLNYPEIKGVGKDVFFLNHFSMEDGSGHSQTKRNQYEAEMMIELARYLILQDYHPSQITILTTYSGQMLLLKETRFKDPGRYKCLNDVKICVVDNYQGEENDIILLSLVRSNRIRSIGFLKTENRICVALSRAKMGFYCIGNFNLLCSVSALWKRIVVTLNNSSNFGQAFPLYCQKHVKNVVNATNVEDFQNAPDGGCLLPCGSVLNCGHMCTRKCHNYDTEHEAFICQKKCRKVLRSCPCDHECTQTCHFGKACPPCEIAMTKTIPKCGHYQRIPCHIHPEDYVCQMKCKNKLSCGHNCQEVCGEPCPKDCPVVMFTTCKLQHRISKLCHESQFHPCETKMEKILPKCGHRQMVPCHMQLHEFACQGECSQLLNCGHPCTNKCGKECSMFCTFQVEAKADCGHSLKMDCEEYATLNSFQLREKCEKRCNQLLPCGHKCTGRCRHCHENGRHARCNKCAPNNNLQKRGRQKRP